MMILGLLKVLKADGCHLGQNDMKINKARSIIGNKIIGVTCHNSIKLAKKAIKSKARLYSFWCILRQQKQKK